jgi:hypothetical protein
MRTMLNTRISIAACALTVASTLSGCSSGDTILALTITSASNVGTVAELRVTVSRAPAAPIVTTFAPDADDAGVISGSFFRRINLGGWKGGDANVLVEALDKGGAVFLTATTTVDVREHGAAAGMVHLTRDVPDGGTGAGGAGGGDAGAGTDAGAGASGGGGGAGGGGGGAGAGGGGRGGGGGTAGAGTGATGGRGGVGGVAGQAGNSVAGGRGGAP